MTHLRKALINLHMFAKMALPDHVMVIGPHQNYGVFLTERLFSQGKNKAHTCWNNNAALFILMHDLYTSQVCHYSTEIKGPASLPTKPNAYPLTEANHQAYKQP